MNNPVTVHVQSWAAWAPDAEDVDVWVQWAAHPSQLSAEGAPKVDFLPAAMRRRVSRLNRMALWAARHCAGNIVPDYSVFGSRHGDLEQTVGLTDDALEGRDLSPTEFSLSVHNTAAGLYSLAQKSRQPSTAIASGKDTFAMALLEAAGYLVSNPAARVLVVVYDARMPICYRAFVDEQQADYALALMLSGSAGQSFTMCSQRSSSPRVAQWPLALEFLRFFLGVAGRYVAATGRYEWVWERSENLSTNIFHAASIDTARSA